MTAVELAKYGMFEYEKRLAAREFQALMDTNGTDNDKGQRVRDRSTYFSTVGETPTAQALTEMFHHSGRGSRPTRQATRYLVHGLHEYKGKFNPQTARALINTIDPAATSLMDPFCGSGTTLIEGMRLGLAATGIDQNPLAAWISRIKVQTLTFAGQRDLPQRFDALVERLIPAVRRGQRCDRAITPHTVSSEDDDYLRNWFPEPILAALWAGIFVCRETDDPVADVAMLCISNIVRQVSWQLPEDLRVRRRPASWGPPSAADLLAKALVRARYAVVETAGASAMDSAPAAAVQCGSSRDAALVESAWPEGRRLVVTSPPYATALPYIDTDRLSIVLLELAPVSDIRGLEQEMTGSREWRTRESSAWHEALTSNSSNLPGDIVDVLNRIETNNGLTNAGFRRRAVPALLYRYFVHMGQTLDALAKTMTAGEHVVMVVGSNRTGSGAHQVDIRTPELLGKLARTRNFTYSERIPLETWYRYGMHSKNAVNAEDAIVMTVA